MRHELIAVTGGKGGVGTTTIAVNLADGAGPAGQRSILVDARSRAGDRGPVCAH